MSGDVVFMPTASALASTNSVLVSTVKSLANLPSEISLALLIGCPVGYVVKYVTVALKLKLSVMSVVVKEDIAVLEVPETK